MKKLFLFLTIGFAVFSSCSDDDNPSNPVTPPGTILFSKDSLSVWFQAGTVSSGSDSVYFSTQNTGGVQIELTVQSNADSTDNSAAYYGIYTNATPVFPYFPFIYMPINEPFSTNVSFASGTTYFAFSVRLAVNNSTQARYVRLVNIKITKL